MAINFVQSTTGSNSVSPTVTTAFGSAVTSGNLIVLAIGNDSALTGQITSITDTGGNTYTGPVFDTVNTATLAMYYAQNVTGGSSFQVTVNWNEAATGLVVVVAQEFSGVATSSSKDVHSSATGASTTPDSGTTGTTAQANELVVGAVCYGGLITTTSLGSGYTNLGKIDIANAGTGQESKVVSSVGTQSATFGLAASRSWIAGVVTFKEASGGTTLGSPYYYLMGR